MNQAFDNSKDNPATGDAIDDDYVSRPGQNEIKVQKDSAPVEDPIDPNTADSDAQLAKDDKDAIDSSNIVEGRTRGETKSKGS
ncbi:hypothetical protein K504DRAFT_534838 [Pleomassaria siparia CBS 279.74]|uniref:Histone chaperone domain-containing protein n=1 Tax=Pleomassaria siparia CBS 279.74 TaxID=1314801 RepID=A0A6G1K604_9PLEO|nr:hypothetical protein K504DRAFT_534838 [Pleomassaria siparia CBS 279.74]